MSFLSRLYWFFPVLVLLGCVTGSKFPVTTPFTLVSDSEWVSKVFYRSGHVFLRFEPEQQSSCYFSFGVHFSDRETQRLSHDIDILFSGPACDNELTVSAAYHQTSSDKYSRYLEKTMPLGQPHQVDVRWKSREFVEIAINGEPFVDAPFGETFGYLKLVSYSGSVTILELEYE